MAPTDRIRFLRPSTLWAQLLLLTVAAGATWWFLGAWQPAPPRVMRMATGPAGSAHAEYGERYRQILARAGVTLELEPTVGALDNVARLNDPESGVAAGFVQAGTSAPGESPHLLSLGTVFYEPLWLFHRGETAIESFNDLRGKRLAIGPDGSATRFLSLRLLALGGIEPAGAELLAYAPEEAADRLLRGDIDGAVFLTSWSSRVVQELLGAPGIRTASFPRADALVALVPILDKRILPAGVADLARGIPPSDVVLVASKASLVVRRDLHPALQFLLLEAATEVHSAPGIFNEPSEFPALESIDLPLSDEALLFHRRGPPFLQRHLPFWLAVLVERLALAIIPFVGILFPLVRGLPAVRTWYVQRRVAMFYGELKLLDMELDDPRSRTTGPQLIQKLDELEKRVSRLRISEDFAALIYGLRQHIRLVRERLEQQPES
jgi:TRAP-type uncharacterized transport system substrate-binding protein